MKKVTEKILIASDHAGFELKEWLKKHFSMYQWEDLGPDNTQSVDYPDFADTLASRIHNEGGMGVLVCGSGQGMCMRANRYMNVRAALCYDVESARLAREHNDANVLCLGGRLLRREVADEIFKTFFTTFFSGGRHALRVEKLKGALK